MTANDGLTPEQIDKLTKSDEERAELIADFTRPAPFELIPASDRDNRRPDPPEHTHAEVDETNEVVEPKPKPEPPEALTFEATAYTAFCDTGCTGVTASGYDVSETIYSPEGYRIIAADPDVLPLGSVVTVNTGGNTFKAKVLDTGGAIDGRRIDLLVGSVDEALQFGRQNVKVVIE